MEQESLVDLMSSGMQYDYFFLGYPNDFIASGACFSPFLENGVILNQLFRCMECCHRWTLH